MTPAEFASVLEGYNQREEYEFMKLKWAVWHVAALERQKRLPSYELFMREKKKRDAKSVEERRREFEELKREMGN